jgi:putative ABC transport system permease protein
VPIFSERLVEKYQQSSEQIMPNQTFKDYANRLFDDTFIVTKALNGFILGIALISLCTSLLSLSENQLKQLVILKNLGVTHTQLLWLKLTQTTVVVGFTTVFAVPLGFALGFALLKFVMPIAFGWTIHFSLDLLTLLIMCVTLIIISVLCAYLPIRKMTRSDTQELP